MLLVIAQLLVNEGKWNDLKPLLDYLVKSSQIEEGCIRFEYYLDPLDTAHLFVLQEWQDRQSLERHEVSDHVAEFKLNAAWLITRRAPTQVYFVDRVEDLATFLSKA
jgi:quinol monooxygenase YgiN